MVERIDSEGSKVVIPVVEISRRLRGDGISQEELDQRAGERLAPGITVAQYMDAQRTFEKVEEVDGIVRYVEDMRPVSK